jgi:Tfp pilus assembly protein PilN
MVQEKNSEINFLSSDRLDEFKIKEELMAAVKMAGIFLVIWLFILSAVLGYGLLLSNKNKTLKKESAALEQKLTQLDDKITLILILKDRLERIDQVFKERQDLSQPLNSFFTGVPAGVSLTEVSLTAKNLTVTGTGDILSISRLTKNFIAQSQDWYETATLKSLVKNEKDVSFTFNLIVGL